ncbi:hypothetical protein DH2020_041830 [Rehmannia glutinosa]|uniref:CBS domain-containing protein n=1 Tax=Rehmannia glutinosa TaxID=99300 RepID=A0ABR0UR37_REHGL
MAVRFLNEEVSELCLGKPELTCVSATATINDALTALKKSGDTHVSVWVCGGESGNGSCVCVGKLCMADVILFLCREENLVDPFRAFEAPVSDILPKGSPILAGCNRLYTRRHPKPSDPNTKPPHHKFKEQVPKQATSFVLRRHNGHKYCWLTQEDILRFLLNSIGAFSPLPTFTIDSLNVIDHDIMTVTYNEPASSALAHFYRSLTEQTSVAVVDEENRLIGEISPFALAYCNETAAGAIMALSAMDLITFIECARPPEDLVNLSGSSLVAVMIQALAHRVSCVWVEDEDHTVVGTVTFAGILKVFGSVAGGRPLSRDG